MKKVLIGSLLCAVFSVSHAQQITWNPVPYPGSTSSNSSSDSGSRNRNYNNNYDYSYGSQNNYRGSSGSRYQYDMSNPSDRLRYSTDTAAQRRDQMAGPDRDRDQARGQYGGGYLGR